VTTLNPSLGRPGTLADLIPGTGALAVVRDAGLVIGGAALTGVAAQVSITVPSITPVPFTLQTFAVLLVGASLGSVRGLLSMALYVVVGLAGVPWFAEGSSGYPAATFGYLLGFVAAAALVGRLSERGDDRRYVSAVGEMVIGSAVIYAFGVTVLMANLNLSLATGLSEGMVPFLIGDGLKVLAAAGLLPLAWKLVNRDKKA